MASDNDIYVAPNDCDVVDPRGVGTITYDTQDGYILGPQEVLTIDWPKSVLEVVTPGVVQGGGGGVITIEAVGLNDAGDVRINPATQETLDAVLTKLTDGIKVREEVQALRDAFGNMRVSSSYNQVEVPFHNPDYTDFVNVTKTTTGNQASSNGQIVLSSGTGSDGSILVKSVDYGIYHPGQELGAGFTWTFPEDASTALGVARKRIGVTSTTLWANGITFGYEADAPTTLALSYFRDGSRIFSHGQANWLDRCDGSVGSQYCDETGNPVALDPTQGQLARVLFGLFGYAGFQVELLNPAAYSMPLEAFLKSGLPIWIPIYRYTGINALNVPVFSDYDLYVAGEIVKTGAGSGSEDLSLTSACWGIWTSSQYERFSRGITDRSLAIVTKTGIFGRSSNADERVEVKVTPAGALVTEATQDTAANLHTAANLYVLDAPVDATNPVPIEVINQITGFATEAKQDVMIATLTDGTQKTQITNQITGFATEAKQDVMIATLTDGTQKAVVNDADTSGAWDYRSGIDGSVTISGRILQITAIALEGAATLQINGGDLINLPYGSTDKISSEISIIPRGNLVDPTIVFTNTDSYFVEFVT